MVSIRALTFYLACSTLFSLSVMASPGLPCITATQSANGRILVTDTLSFEDPDETHPRKIMGSVYQVYRRFADPNESLYLEGPNSYWADPFWKVETHRKPGALPLACSYVLVPDDGEYLVLVGMMQGLDALTIYHHRPYDPALGPLVSQQGVLVKRISQEDLWPSNRHDQIFFDFTPKWFEDVRFSFSSDQRLLRLEDRHGRKVEVVLATGTVRRLK